MASNAGLSAWYQGAVSFLWYLTSSIVQPLFGAYADRHGRWWFMPSACCWSCCRFRSHRSRPPLGPLALVVVGGLGAAIMHPEAGQVRGAAQRLAQFGRDLDFSNRRVPWLRAGTGSIAALLAHFGRFGSLVLLPPGLLAVGYVYVVSGGRT